MMILSSLLLQQVLKTRSVEDVVPLSARFEDEEDDDDGDFPPAFIKNRRV